MIILIGGVARSGKTLLAHKLFDTRRIAIIHLDIFREMFEHAMGSLGIANGNNPDTNARQMWRFVKAFILESIAQNESYIIEGSDLLPQLVGELLPNHAITAVFLGYGQANTAAKVAAIRKHPEKREWTASMTDMALGKFVDTNIRRSQLIKEQCEQADIPYAETSSNFEGAIASSAELLLRQIPG